MNRKEDMNQRLIAIACVQKDGAIGKDNKLPWRIPEELLYFKHTTMGY